MIGPIPSFRFIARSPRGEKRADREDKERQFSERYYGRFERRIPLGYEVEQDKIDARVRNGVLTVVIPKSERAQSQVLAARLGGAIRVSAVAGSPCLSGHGEDLQRLPVAVQP